MASGHWEAVMGLEIHAQLKTESKIFSSDSATFGGSDNEFTSPTSLGLPGSLPVLNEKALDYAIAVGLALGCTIRKDSYFARKNYFYPDLPKGYQISQYSKAVAENGSLDFEHGGEVKKVRINRAHLEEDAGKSTHHGDHSLINLNRAGVPLLEIVSEPDIRSAGEAAEYARSIRRILRYLEVCDGNLEEGSLRCDCNISVRERGAKEYGTRVEIKNLNSFRFVEKALDYEIERQIDLLEAGSEVLQETRLYDSAKNRTSSMRTKEEAEDYRYFPDPDLPIVKVQDDRISGIKKSLPELPAEKLKRFIEKFGLSKDEAHMLIDELSVADYYERLCKSSKDPKLSANWVLGEIFRKLNDTATPIEDAKVTPEAVGELIGNIKDGKISGKMAKEVFGQMWATGQGADQIIESQGLSQITDEGPILDIINKLLSDHPGEAEEYRQGKTKVLGFFVGQVMKATKGKASPDVVNRLLKKALGDSA